MIWALDPLLDVKNHCRTMATETTKSMSDSTRQFSKRAIDLTIAAVALISLSPLLTVCAVLVRWRLGSPVLFWQERAGLVGRPFLIFKFRTMTDKKDVEGKLLVDEFRITRLGQFLRSSSLDELPGLWNVLVGEMSLVGPRPLPTRYLSRYTTEQQHRHRVRPGITGLAQIQGRNRLSWEEKFRWDIQYVKQHTLWLDLKIMLLTIVRVLRRDGISSGECVSAPEFTGSNTRQAA